MNNILNEFNLNVTNLVESFLKKELENGLSNFTDNLNDELMKLGRDITSFTINELERIIFESKERKQEFESKEKDSRKIISIFGEIEYKRRYYKKLETGKYSYLTDELLKIAPEERLIENVETRLIDNASKMSYEESGKRAAYGVEISKQTVMNKIEELNFEEELETKEIKRQVKNIYIIADEDHVALQTGGIAMPRMIIVYDDLNKVGKRIELKNKKHFGGIYKARIDDLWEEVLNYLENEYELSKVTNIFIMGDGANWIKTGLEWIPGSKYVADEFHILEALKDVCSKESTELYSDLVKCIRENDFKRLEELGEFAVKNEDSNVENRRREKLRYVLNNEEGLRAFNFYSDELHGCSAEGHVSHLLSARMSSLPMGWKEDNVNNMSKLRYYLADGKQVKDLIKNKNKIIEFPNQEKARHFAHEKSQKSYPIPIYNHEIEFNTYDEKELFKHIMSRNIAV